MHIHHGFADILGLYWFQPTAWIKTNIGFSQLCQYLANCGIGMLVSIVLAHVLFVESLKTTYSSCLYLWGNSFIYLISSVCQSLFFVIFPHSISHCNLCHHNLHLWSCNAESLVAHVFVHLFCCRCVIINIETLKY